MTEVIIASNDNRSFSAYVARPVRTPAPALVLIQYICGVNSVMRRLADQFAAMGWLVAVPDLFWRQEPGVQLISDPARPSQEEMTRALALNAGIVDDLAVADLIATANTLRGHADCDGRVGALGYCLGGRLVVPFAARAKLDCAISYYGVNLDGYLSEAETIASPLLLHVAGEDALVPATVRQALVERLGAQPNATVMLHAGVNHAFALPSGPNYSAKAAICANAASYEFLYKSLSPRH